MMDSPVSALVLKAARNKATSATSLTIVEFLVDAPLQAFGLTNNSLPRPSEPHLTQRKLYLLRSTDVIGDRVLNRFRQCVGLARDMGF
jgi:hypothetical protein